MAKMKSADFVAKLIDVAKNHKTLYVMGCFGAPMNATNKTRYCTNHDYNKNATRTAMIQAATADTFGFDCVGLIKGILWGWAGNTSKTYGGAGYAVNGVPDTSADGMIGKCSEVKTTGWADMVPGELLWKSGHVGVYIGNGQAVECTPTWNNGVQITTVLNIKSGRGHKWTKHGKLPYVAYSTQVVEAPASASGVASTQADEKAMWAYLKGKGLSDVAAAVVLGHFLAESALRSDNLQDSYQGKVGHNDKSYTAAVDNGTYGNFVKDAAGYGLAQWTYWTRKQALLDFARSAKKSIGDWRMQIDFFWKEVQSYGAVVRAFQSNNDIKAVSDIFMVKYEAPADQSEAAKARRAGYCQSFYNKYAGTTHGEDCENNSAPTHGEESTPETETTHGEDFKVNDIVAFKADAVTYHPGGATIPSWVKNGFHHVVTQTESNGKPVVKGGAVCVLLGGKVQKGDTAKLHGINTWVAVENLEATGNVAVNPVYSPELDYAQDFTSDKAGAYTVLAKGGLNVRSGASLDKAIIQTLPFGATVRCYGYHTGEWLYVLAPDGRAGFCCGEYLTKA